MNTSPAANYEGLPPLHLTAQSENINTAALLLFAGANRAAKNNRGQHTV